MILEEQLIQDALGELAQNDQQHQEDYDGVARIGFRITTDQTIMLSAATRQTSQGSVIYAQKGIYNVHY